MADILVVTGSPRAGGNTSMLADAFIEGAESAGNAVTRVDVGRADIAGCLGCNYCFSHEGACCQVDDMQEIYPLLHRCDTLAYVTPIYCFTFSAPDWKRRASWERACGRDAFGVGAPLRRKSGRQPFLPHCSARSSKRALECFRELKRCRGIAARAEACFG